VRRSFIRAGQIFALSFTQLQAQQTAQSGIEASCLPEKDPCRLGSALHLHFDQQSADIQENALTFELVLDDRVMKGLKARSPLQPDPPDKDRKSGGWYLIFDLKRLPSDAADAKANHDAWNGLLSDGDKRNLPVGLAEGGNRVDDVNTTIWFDVLPSWWPVTA
jgi:hypothetical protein